MPDHPADHAIREYWAARTAQWSLSGTGGYAKQGRAPHRLLVDALVEELVKYGLDPATIRIDEPLELADSYREVPSRWDLLIVEDEVPVAAVNIRSQDGRSVGKNYRNRADDIVAAAADFGRSYSPSGRRLFRPFLGLVFVLEESQETTRSPGASGSTNYQERFRGLFQRLVDDEMYDAICYLLARQQPSVAVSEPEPTMGFSTLAQTLVKRVAELRELRKRHDLGAAGVAWRLSSRSDLDEVVSAVASTEKGGVAVETAVIRKRRELLAKLREIVSDENARESAVQAAIGKHYWIFGGQYTGILERRDTMPLDQHDIPLVCADRSIHIVELKRPGAKLVAWHRNHPIVSTDVHEAVSQCMNYIRTIDELGPALETLHRKELGFDYDYRRAKGTVVIGHPDHVRLDGVTRAMIDQTIRSYNAHLSRVQVLTYADLIESAERMLRFNEDELVED